ncbi:MAG: ParB/RepB/Spo0J family partition protein [Tissierellia bacterium]|nr:ParB/RepB/Spo0J family partition protein [Tissierellia bacterium]
MAVKKRGLGKGLSALISEDLLVDENSEKEAVEYIDINLISPNKNQPRKNMDKKALAELADSIKAHGLIQPIIIRKVGKKYEIIAGERRWRASKIAGLEEIPCIIKDIDDKVSSKYALIENIQREDLNPIEEAIAYKKLMEDYDLTQEELAKELGKSRSYIANTVRLLNLHEKVIEYISKGQLTAGHGKALLSIKDKEKQLQVAEEIIKKGLNVRDVENISNKKDKKKDKDKKEPYIIEVEENLMRILGTKVNLVQGKKKGKIEIEYYGNEDLERIIDILKGVV